MKLTYILLIILPMISFGQTKPQNQKSLLLAPVLVTKKCDKKHHILNSIALTFPPCYDCACGRHLSFDMKTFMALEIKYGDSVDGVISNYMKDGRWYNGLKLIDSVEIDNLASRRYGKFQKEIDSIFKINQ